MKGWIYFIQSTSPGNPIKIGYAGNTEGRLRQLRTGHPGRLTLLARFPGTRAQEKKLHRQFRPNRIFGEWFHPVPELLELVSAAKAGALTPAEESIPNVTPPSSQAPIAPPAIRPSTSPLPRSETVITRDGVPALSKRPVDVTDWAENIESARVLHYLRRRYWTVTDGGRVQPSDPRLRLNAGEPGILADIYQNRFVLSLNSHPEAIPLIKEIHRALDDIEFGAAA